MRGSGPAIGDGWISDTANLAHGMEVRGRGCECGYTASPPVVGNPANAALVKVDSAINITADKIDEAPL